MAECEIPCGSMHCAERGCVAPVGETTKIGTERFNYDMQRHEILLETGWQPTLEYDHQTGIYRRTPGAVGQDREPDYRPGAADAAYRQAHQAIVDKRNAADQLGALAKLLSETQAQLRDAKSESATLKVVNGALTMAVQRGSIALGGMSRVLAERAHENGELRKRLWLPVEPGQHDYHGPTKKDPDTGERTPVPDPVHERFHGAVGDVLAGRVIPEARRQMQEALKNAPKEKAPIPTSVPMDDPKRMGWRL